MDKEMVQMALGALLHDVGKITQRSRWQLSPQSKGLESMICRTNPAGQYTHRHVLYTNEFFERLDTATFPKVNYSEIANLASYHHAPRMDKLEEVIVQQADWLSAGQDRRDRQEDASPGYLKVPLRSVFYRLSLQDNPPDAPWSYPVAPCRIEEGSIFPNPEQSEKEKLVEQYSQLADEFLTDCKCLESCPPHLLVDSCISLCRLYMANVPSTTMDEPDVSLFDHALTTAAFACALLAYHKASGSLTESAVLDRDQPKFLLVSGDLSGIQNFLLDLPSEKTGGMAKILRARSFYLTLLTRAASRLLLNRLGLPACNCILDAGGRFVLLTHNTKKAREIITNTHTEMSDWLLSNFQGKIALNVSSPLPLTGKDFACAKFRSVMEELIWRTDLAKKQRMSECLQENGTWSSSRQVGRYQDPEKRNDYFKILGGQLPHMKYVLLESSTNRDTLDDLSNLYGQLKMVISTGSTLELTADTVEALALNPDKSVPGFTSYNLVNHIPVVTSGELPYYRAANVDKDRDGNETMAGDTKTFEQIGWDSVELQDEGVRRGVPFIAALKADVDRLGLLFSDGLGHRYSIGRMATFSRQMDMFFRGYLHQLTAQQFPNIYTEYSGGDDLLFIGPWTDIIRFALELRRKFKLYTCRNNNINLSAAVILAHPHHPVARVVEKAETSLSRAKNSGRNCINALGVILSWEDFEQSIENGDFLDGLMNASTPSGRKKLGNSFVYRLLQYHKMYQRTQQNGSVRDMLWRSHLAYDIHRNVKDKVLATDLRRIESMTQLSAAGREMEMLGASATYALYRNRGGKL